MATQATRVRKVEKVWSVLKVHLAQLAHRVLVAFKEKLVKEETWVIKVNQVAKARREILDTQASRVRKVWLVLQVHLAQLVHRVLVGHKVKME